MDLNSSNSKGTKVPSRLTKKRRWAPLILVVLGVALLASIWAFVSFKQFAHKVEPVMTALNIYTDTLIAKDYQSAYAITSPAFREATSYSELVDYQSRLTNRMGNLKTAKQKYWEVNKESGSSMAKIEADMQFERGELTFQFVLRKEDGIWRVLSSQAADGTILGPK